MKNVTWGVFLFLFICFTNMAYSADIEDEMSIKSSMDMTNVKRLLPGDIAFYWGDQQHPAIEQSFGNFKASRKTNGFGKSREDACTRAMAAALEALQERARKEGGNAVINIMSNIRNYPTSSQERYKCLVGRVMVNVALKGDVVLLENSGLPSQKTYDAVGGMQGESAQLAYSTENTLDEGRHLQNAFSRNLR